MNFPNSNLQPGDGIVLPFYSFWMKDVSEELDCFGVAGPAERSKHWHRRQTHARRAPRLEGALLTGDAVAIANAASAAISAAAIDEDEK